MISKLKEIFTLIYKFLLPLSLGKRILLSGLFFLFFLALLLLPEQTNKFDRLFWDLAQKNISSLLEPSPELAIVAIDTETLEAVKERWPWSRSQFAHFLKVINSFGPGVIVLDIVFQQPESSDDGVGDQIFTKTLQEIGNVALIGFVEEELTDFGRQQRQFRSLKKFRDAAYCDGFVHSFIDSDSKIRTFSIKNEKLDEDGCLLKVAERTRTTDRDLMYLKALPEKSHIIFARKNGGIPLYRGLDLIQGKVSGNILKNKIVIVGATAQVLHDYHETCLGLMSGPEILAYSLDTIISGRVSAPYNGLFLRFILIVAGFFVSILMALRKRLRHEAAVITVYILSLLASYHLFAFFFIFPPLSCFFLSWAFLGLSCNFMKRFVELIEQQISQAEANLAGEIQAELFPGRSIVNDNYSIRGTCIPCDATGGDFFDYFELEDRNLVFIVGDVSGHGFSAAILTIMAKTTIQLLRHKNMALPENIVSTLNQIIFELVKKKKFMTLAVGHINVQTHRLELVLAGSLPPVVINKTGELQELKKNGFPMGIVKKLPIKAISYDLLPGDSIVLATDGIVEALNWKDELYTFPAWYSFLQRTMPTFTDKTKLDELLAEVNKHRAGRSFGDDVTFVVIKRHPG
ncbi:MAG: SpoIIE family protein phosphatase [Candidatus Rifleibacteriota bacterium]